MDQKRRKADDEDAIEPSDGRIDIESALAALVHLELEYRAGRRPWDLAGHLAYLPPEDEGLGGTWLWPSASLTRGPADSCDDISFGSALDRVSPGWAGIVTVLYVLRQSLSALMREAVKVVCLRRTRSGGLAIALSPFTSEYVLEVVDALEEAAGQTCEICGAPGRYRHHIWGSYPAYGRGFVACSSHATPLGYLAADKYSRRPDEGRKQAAAVRPIAAEAALNSRVIARHELRHELAVRALAARSGAGPVLPTGFEIPTPSIECDRPENEQP